jgi:glyoxylase-like metal-dependent hydrolase (beta-lactamase superfamily II)
MEAPSAVSSSARAPSAWGRPDTFEEIAPGVARLEIGFVNVYALGEPGGPWVLVDTGLPGTAALVKRAAKERFGSGAGAIVLTHGHFDHAGNARALSDEWDTPVYAHDAELPFLTGRSAYPPQDPTPGGAICFLSRFFPREGIDLGPRVEPLPQGDDSEQGPVPEAGDWRWMHTPGHTPGHVSLFREASGESTERPLLAGDALATMDLDDWTTQATHAQRLSRPPTPFTPDWQAARRSLQQLADLEPTCIGAGHGPPLTRADTAAQLRDFVEHRFAPPRTGRYAAEPIEADADAGVTYIPPPVDDPLPRRFAAGAAALGGVALAVAFVQRRG